MEPNNPTHDGRLGRVEARLDSIEMQVNRIVDSVDKLAGIAGRPTRTNWGWILAAVALTFSAGGGYTNIVTSSIRTNNVRQEERLDNLDRLMLERTYSIGYNTSTIHHLEDQLNEVDLYGSRKWVDRSKGKDEK